MASEADHTSINPNVIIYHLGQLCSSCPHRKMVVLPYWLWRLCLSCLAEDQGRILVQVTIYRRLQIGRDGHLDQSDAYDISNLYLDQSEAYDISCHLYEITDLHGKHETFNQCWLKVGPASNTMGKR